MVTWDPPPPNRMPDKTQNMLPATSLAASRKQFLCGRREHLCFNIDVKFFSIVEFKKTYIEDKHGNNERIAGVNKDGMYRCDYLAVYELLPHINKMNPADILQYALVMTIYFIT